MMNKKILAFIYNGKKFLSLRNNPENANFGGDFWFTVTGTIEENESAEDAVKREIREEIGLEVDDILYLNFDSIYKWAGKEHLERNYIVFTKDNEIKLDNEHVEYKWQDIVSFIKDIKWDYNKKELFIVLNKAVKKELFYKKQKIIDFRINNVKINC